MRRTNNRYQHIIGRMMKTLHPAVLAGIILLAVGVLASCSFDYQQPDEVKEVDHPDFILDDTTYIVSRQYTDPISFLATHAEFFSRKHSVTLSSVTFEQLDEEGVLVVEGSADEAVIDTDTNDTELKGNIVLVSESEELHIRTDTLFWDHEEQLLTCPDETLVEVIYDDGSTISGYGFRADFSLRSIEFAKETQGVVQYE